MARPYAALDSRTIRLSVQVPESLFRSRLSANFNIACADHPADSPASHRIGLGHAVEADPGVRDLGRHRGRQRVPGVAVDEVGVDVVSGYPEPVAGRPPADLSYLLRRVDGTRRVGRRGEQEQPGPLGAGRLDR